MDSLQPIPEGVVRSVMDDLVRYPTRVEPYWVQVMGIPGAGKTEFVHMLQEALAFRKPHTLAATDEYLVQIPDFQTMVDREAAFRTYDPVATALGMKVHRQLIAQKSDVLFERSLSSVEYRDLMYDVKKAGYRLITVLVRAEPAVAKARTSAREAVTGRHVPESVIDERVVLVEERWAEMQKLADYMLEVTNDGEVSALSALSATVTLVADYVQKMPV